MAASSRERGIAYSSQGSHQALGRSLMTGVHILDVSCHNALKGDTAAEAVVLASARQLGEDGVIGLTGHCIWESCPPRSSYVGTQALYVHIDPVH